MKVFCRFLILVTINLIGIAQGIGMGRYHNEGEAFVKDFKNKRPEDKDLANVTGFSGTNIEQAKYGEEELKTKVSGSFSSSEEAKFISESNNARPRFDIDPSTNPLLTSADSIVNNPESVLNVTEIQDEAGENEVKKTLHTCLKGRSSFDQKCHRTLIPQKVGVRSEEKEYIVNFDYYGFYIVYKTHPYFDQSFHSDPYDRDYILNKVKSYGKIVDACSNKEVDIDVSHLKSAEVNRFHGELLHTKYQIKNNLEKAFKYVEIKLKTTVDIPVYELVWVDDCETLEKSVDRGDCEYGEFRCVEKGETRIVEGVPLKASCWKEERVYRCHGEEKNTCQDFAKKGCFQMSSKCKTFEGKECIEWEQTYECEEGSKKLSKMSLSGEKPFCLDGDCTNQSWAPNQDMADALSKLSIFQSIKKDMDPKTKVIFNGEVGKCSRLVTGFRDCCQKNGWGVKIGLSSCKAKHKLLAENRKKDKCIRVGTYCSKKELGVCVKKKTSFCCYQSKLARIINEQGKRQLGLSFGTPEEPNCTGLTLDQLTKLDFSKIDLSELFQDLMSNMKLPNVTKVSEEVKRSMENNTYSINDKSKRITQGRSNDNF